MCSLNQREFRTGPASSVNKPTMPNPFYLRLKKTSKTNLLMNFILKVEPVLSQQETLQKVEREILQYLHSENYAISLTLSKDSYWLPLVKS